MLEMIMQLSAGVNLIEVDFALKVDSALFSVTQQCEWYTWSPQLYLFYHVL